MKFTIKSLLQTRSPLHIAHPNSARMSDTGEKTYNEKAFPMTSVQTQTIPLREPMEYKVKNKDGTETKHQSFSRTLPVIAANNIAGRLRRHAARQVLVALKENGHKVSLHAYSVLSCGASTGNPDSTAVSYQEFKDSRQHVYFGLFGGGPKMFERHLRVHSALPITPLTREVKGTLAHPAAASYTHQNDTKFTRMWGFRRLDDLADLSNMDLAEQSIEKFDEVFSKRQAANLEHSTNKKNAEKAGETTDSKRPSTKTYSAIEFVVPGVVFDLTMELDVHTNAQVGLFLETLDSFAQTERLGGQIRNGFGVVTFELVSFTREGGNANSIFNNGRLDRNNPDVMAWLAAWAEEAKTLDAASIEKLIAVTEKLDKKAKKSETSDSDEAETAEQA